MCWLLGAFAALAASSAGNVRVRTDLRHDGVPVRLSTPAELVLATTYDFRNFPDDYVAAALAKGCDWRAAGAVTPAKDQGPHGYCGTFGRTGAAEGQFARLGGGGLRNFSEEMLVECVGWDRDQFGYFSEHGYMDMADYPYNMSGPDRDPPIPGAPCRYDAAKAIPGTAGGKFTETIGRAPTEEQLAAFVFRNGPTNSGINSGVFALLPKDCRATGDCFVTLDMCDRVRGTAIDHSILLVGFGRDAERGPFWIVKNSWGARWGDAGFVKVAMGYNDPLYGSCAGVACCGWAPAYGDPAAYFVDHTAPPPAAPVYRCNKQAKVCEQVDAGSAGATSLQECETACGLATPVPAEKVYKCNKRKQQCVEVAPGTKGAASLAVCDQQCGIETPAPVPAPTKPEQRVFTCNAEEKVCEEVPAGTKGATSLHVCDIKCGVKTPVPATPKPVPTPVPEPTLPEQRVYKCNAKKHTCDIVPAGTAGASSLQDCDAACGVKTPAPSPVAKVYKCNEEKGQCEVVPAGTEGAVSLDVCKVACGAGVSGF